jgi:hypothetical protein
MMMNIEQINIHNNAQTYAADPRCAEISDTVMKLGIEVFSFLHRRYRYIV